MRMFSGMRPWQKAFMFGVMFMAILGLIFTIVLIIADLILSSKGLVNTCYMVTKTVECNLGDAIGSRLLFYIVFIVAIGLPVGFFSGLIGYLFERIQGS